MIEEVLPQLQADPATLDKLYIRSPATNQMVPLGAFAKWTTAPVQPLSISHQGQFPAVTISFNLAQDVALGTATEAVQRAERELQLPRGLTTTFQGNAQAFQDSLTTVPLLILAALVSVYLILGVLYESFIHPLTILSTLPSAGLGALATLMLFGYEFSLVALIGTILLIGIVKKNGIMMVDFAIAAERDEGLTTVEAIRKAALLRFRPIMMTTMAALLGGVPLMLSRWQRLRVAPAAWLHDGRRPPRQPSADAVHDADHLSLSRPRVALALRRVRQGEAAARKEAGREAAGGARAGSAVRARLGRGARQGGGVTGKPPQVCSHPADFNALYQRS